MTSSRSLVPLRRPSVRGCRHTVVAGALAAFVLLPVSCSSSGSSDGASASSSSSASSTTTPAPPASLSQVDFLARANAICKSGNSKIDALLAAIGDPPTPQEEQDVFNGLMGNITDQLDQIDALEPPPALSAGVDELLASARSDIAGARAEGAETFLGQGPGQGFDETNAKATALGLTDCAS